MFLVKVKYKHSLSLIKVFHLHSLAKKKWKTQKLWEKRNDLPLVKRGVINPLSKIHAKLFRLFLFLSWCYICFVFFVVFFFHQDAREQNYEAIEATRTEERKKYEDFVAEYRVDNFPKIYSSTTVRAQEIVIHHCVLPRLQSNPKWCQLRMPP